MERTIIRDYLEHGASTIGFNSIHLEDSNELVYYNNTNDKFVRFSLDSFTGIEYDYPDISLKTLTLAKSGKIFGSLNSNTIVEISPTTGEIIEEIFVNDSTLDFLSYSESTGRFYWLDNASDNSVVYIYNPANQVKTAVPFQENFTKIFTDY